ncbi:hypothetical protein [Chelativorans sp. YIM 93263]|uniref:hypothetical protein n=1 Tax=Chelativorans sp. YIM 93263 TaxID=2906648 RepID=UPI0023787CCB|nr:hypothetical protein [Chelativorans sp. YIM 93263]
MRTIFFGVVGLVAMSAVASAQEQIPACQEQQQLEQVLASDGEIMPESCRQVSISVLENNGDRLCLVDLTGESEGFVEQLQEAAVEQRWWILCEEVEAAIQAP